jgi:hypothetical protein
MGSREKRNHVKALSAGPRSSSYVDIDTGVRSLILIGIAADQAVPVPFAFLFIYPMARRAVIPANQQRTYFFLALNATEAATQDQYFGFVVHLLMLADNCWSLNCRACRPTVALFRRRSRTIQFLRRRQCGEQFVDY